MKRSKRASKWRRPAPKYRPLPPSKPAWNPRCAVLISWTRIFGELEQVLPHNVRIISVRPQVTPQNEIYLEMVVGSLAPEPIIEMLMRLESSEQFGATLVNNWLPPSQTEPLYRYRVSVNYAQKL
ncbi:MAG: hypothetical protein HY013_01680 [Candidatus Solibacter usitatus]|nr:hypothetical protein [Candidatus Solibacter usitatus]